MKGTNKCRFASEINSNFLRNPGVGVRVDGEVLDAAAKETGFEVVELGPLPRKLSSRPRFTKAYDKTTQYIYNMHNELDEAAGVLRFDAELLERKKAQCEFDLSATEMPGYHGA